MQQLLSTVSKPIGPTTFLEEAVALNNHQTGLVLRSAYTKIELDALTSGTAGELSPDVPEVRLWL